MWIFKVAHYRNLGSVQFEINKQKKTRRLAGEMFLLMTVASLLVVQLLERPQPVFARVRLV